MEFLRRRFLCWRNGLESEFSSAKKLFEKACHSVTQYIWVCGCERFEPNFTRWNARFVFLMVNICVFMAGFVKAYMYSHDTIYELLQYNLKRFENTKRMPEIHHSLVNTASLCTASVKLIGPCYASMGAFTIFISIVISLYYGRFELPFGFYLPGLDRATWIGYLLNLAFHILQVFEAVTGLLAADMCFFNLMINAVGQLDVMVIYLRKLGGAANTDKYEDALAEPELNELLSELIENHCEHRKYLTKMESLMQAGFFINNGCLIAETVTSLFVILTSDEIWIPGILIAVVCTFQLIIPCFMGSLLSSKNDELIREVYNTPWNELPFPAQKALGTLLQFAQNPVTLSDGFAPIDLDSFLEIYKKIYSYLAMIQNIN
ncbi:Odorant receptor 94b [Culex quinquefasciatus]|uniref:Odorant receptor n=2 Tax=Culex quinquefasciatus TaxID=7176 RepID=B0W596_CULQU|nr:Odorant receptor 94b [Culex quinquefasciatus]|eukprot:XP_001843880.1 Odorant receptor 94b [Culex quinquefasciatus]